jgi:tight adherence protein C
MIASVLLPALAAVAVLCVAVGVSLRRAVSGRSVAGQTALAGGAAPGLRRNTRGLVPGLWRESVRRLADAVQPLVHNAGASRLARRLAWTGTAQTPEQFVANQVLAGALGAALAVTLALIDGFGSALLWAGLLGGAVGWWLPAHHLESRCRSIRSDMGRAALGFADFLVAAMQAGLPLEEAIDRVGRELPGRLPALMARAVRQSALTHEPLDMVLEALAEEVDDRNLTGVVGVISQARQTGGDLAGPLAGLVSALRQERQQQVRAVARGRAAFGSLPLIFVMLPGVMAPLAYLVVASFHGMGF